MSLAGKRLCCDAQGIAVAVNFLFTFAMGQAFLSMLCGMQWGIFLLFACFCVLMTAFVWIFLPGAPQPPTCKCCLEPKLVLSQNSCSARVLRRPQHIGLDCFMMYLLP